MTISRPVVAVLALLYGAGCATSPTQPSSAANSGTIGEVLVLSANTTPQISFDVLVGEPARSAAAAGAGTLGDCLSGLFSGSSCSGSFCGAMVLVGFGLCGGAALVVGGIEAARAPKRGEVADALGGFRDAVDRRAVQEGLREQVALNIRQRGEEFLPRPGTQAEALRQRGADLATLDAAGVPTVLQTDLTYAGLERTGKKTTYVLSVRAGARLLRTHDGAELLVRQFSYVSAPHTVAQWAENRSARLIAALAAAYDALGAHIFDDVFRLYPWPVQKVQSAGMLSAAFGLAPVYPATRGQLSADQVIGPTFEWVEVNSLRPTLQWQAFPRQADVAAAPDEMARVRDVRYDLIVAREDLGYPADVAYRRSGLPAPRHTLETALQPGARYFWSVRASFDLDGRRRLTQWSSVRSDPEDRQTMPNQAMYRFRTPGS